MGQEEELKQETNTAQSATSDNRTAEEASLRSNDDTFDDYCAYSIVVRTSSDKNSATDGSVFIQLADKDGNKTSKCRLNCSISHRRKFQRGHSDLFVLTEQNMLSELKYVEVWLQRRDESVSWKLHSINVIEHATHRLYRFSCGKWLGDENEKSVGNYIQLETSDPPIAVLRDEFFRISG